MTMVNWGLKRPVSLPPSSPLSPPELDVPWPYCIFSRHSACYVNLPQAYSTRFGVLRFRHPYSASSPNIPDSVLDLPRFHNIFILFVRPFDPPDSVNFFSTITDRPRAPRIYASMLLNIPRPPPTFRSQQFSNGLYFNRLSVSYVAGGLLNVFFDRINVPLLQLTFWICYFSPGSTRPTYFMSQLTFWIDYFSTGWKYLTCSATYQRFARIRGCLYKQRLNLFFL
jgi:hypothetical protein